MAARPLDLTAPAPVFPVAEPVVSRLSAPVAPLIELPVTRLPGAGAVAPVWESPGLVTLRLLVSRFAGRWTFGVTGSVDPKLGT